MFSRLVVDDATVLGLLFTPIVLHVAVDAETGCRQEVSLAHVSQLFGCDGACMVSVFDFPLSGRGWGVFSSCSWSAAIKYGHSFVSQQLCPESFHLQI